VFLVAVRILPLIALLAALLALPAAAGAQITSPVAVTGDARDVGRASATVTGTVDANGGATTYHFEYGTSSGYGLQTPERSAGTGDAPVNAEALLEGLTSETTYHYSLVATNAAGISRGADRTFRTAAPPRSPGAVTGAAREIGPQAATVAATVDPNASPTTYRIEYGTSTRYGSFTEPADAGSGDGPAVFRTRLEGLRAYTRYHYRVVATNAVGTTRGSNRSFTTARLPTAVSIALSPPRVLWNTRVEVTGRVSGAGVNGIPVALERQDFPFTGAFSSFGVPAPVRAARDGRYRFETGPLFSTTRLRVLTRTQVVVISPEATASVALRVGLIASRAPRRRTRLRGTVTPAAPNGRASLQRLSASGRWLFQRRTALVPSTANRSAYAFILAPRRRSATYRVVVIADDAGAHVPGASRAVTVRGKKPKPRRRR
jgi:hypothetical protein